jgi:type I restriction enzyme, S subunit
MTVEWEEKRLGEVIDIKHGFAFSGENIHDEPHGDILLTPGNFAIGGGFKGDKFKYFDGEVPNEYVLHEGDLLVTMTDLSKQADTLGYPAMLPNHNGRRFLHNQRLGKVLVKAEAEIDERFLFYLLRTREYRDEVLASATGTTVKHTSPRRILAYKAKFPPLPEQKAIAAVLGALDDKIELNQRMNATLDAMARALFQSWFVDFDPVCAKLDGRQPTGLAPATAALFPNEFEESELGPIPKGWSVKDVAHIATRIAMGPFGSRITRDNFVPNGVPVVRGGNLKDGFVDNDFVFLTEAKADDLKASVARSLDLVFTHRGTLGQVGIIPQQSRYPRYVVSQSQMLLSVDRQKISSWMVYLFFSSPIGERALLANTSTTGVPAISRPTTSLKAVLIVIPPIAISERFDEIIQPLFLRREQNAAQLRNLAALRDTLLPKLLSGHLRILCNN